MNPEKSTLLCLGFVEVSFYRVLGFLDAIFESRKFTDIRGYSSVGMSAIITSLIIAGYSVRDVMVFLAKFETLPFFFHLDLSNSKIESEEFAASTRFFSALRKKISKKIPGSLSLEAFYYQTLKEFYICARSCTEEQDVFFSHSSHPDVDLIEVLKLSVTVPHIGVNRKLGNHSFADASITNPLPLEPLQTLNSHGNFNVIAMVATCDTYTNSANSYSDGIKKILLTPLCRIIREITDRNDNAVWTIIVNTHSSQETLNPQKVCSDVKKGFDQGLDFIKDFPSEDRVVEYD